MRTIATFLVITIAVLAKAQLPESLVWNASKGFPFADGHVAVLDNKGPQLQSLEADFPAGKDDFAMSMVVANKHNSAVKKYEVHNGNGAKRKVRNPRWSVVFASNEDGEVSFSFCVNERADGFGMEEDVNEIVVKDGNGKETTVACSEPNPKAERAMWRFGRRGGVLALLTATGDTIARADVGESSIDAIRIEAQPGAAVEVGSVYAKFVRDGAEALRTEWTRESMAEHLRGAKTSLEGYWKILDRTTDENLLRMGGNYTLACVRTAGGYDLLYVDGARVNAQAWEPGMRKAELWSTGAAGVYDVVWYDAMCKPLSQDVKAQMDADGIMTIFFPYQESQLRLHKTTEPNN